ncbi:DoxX family protein [Maribacter algarum]|uniref:DoxX family protein n=1 Tax=Maribacter algarum (ex Zhang et al. 2020) TaxID=2578118 RepID=A0A5S3PGN9_9FLAO|nr:DoxX family protein [Maribacter algarum]TMM53293.1 DoxX family protein [Maribacter algarum]
MKTIYWTTTGILSLFLLWSSYTYLFSKGTIDGVRNLGFPDHFRVQLAILKVIAVVLILVPQIPLQVKEWAYVGIALFFLTAIIAHTAHKDPFFITMINMVLVALLVISNIYLHKISAD